MDKRDNLKMLQRLPLDIKIQKSIARIHEMINEFGVNGLYVYYSGGKDSKVLHEIVKLALIQFGYDEKSIPRVYCDTGLEWESVRKEGLKSEIVIKPKMNFVEVIKRYGYPAITKEQSQFIYQYRTAKSEKTKHTRIYGNSAGRGKISNKWLPLIRTDFMVGDKCCDVMKKQPFTKFEKETGRIGMIGTMATESQLRMKNYLEEGCNALNRKRPYSMPLGFWTNKDILEYLNQNNIKIPKIYGEIISDLIGNLELTGEQRTGCVFCIYGCHLDNFSKFEYLKKNYPKIYDYCMRGGKYNDQGLWVPYKGLGMSKVIKTIKNLI